MRTFALNHMTTPQWPTRDLITLAVELGCGGVELRTDLVPPLFDGADPEAVRQQLEKAGLTLHAIAEVSAFDDGSERAQAELVELAGLAERAGAVGVSLIPRNDGLPAAAPLEHTLAAVAPVLERFGVIGFIEPLGFPTASLRFKAPVVAAIESLGLGGRIQLIHDTFHHCLAGERAVFAEHTGIVHVSGVVDRSRSTEHWTDADRVLVDADDRVGNLDQLRQLDAGGFQGPVSVEAFAPSVHALDAPQGALANTFHCIRSGLAASAA